MKGTVINTFNGRIEPITFKNFLKLIPVKEHPKREITVLYRRRPAFNYPFDSYRVDFEKEIRQFLYPIRRNMHYKDLLKDIPIQEVSKFSLTEMIFDITTECAYNMGYPTHVIRLSPRIWLAANPEDYVIYANDLVYALASYAPQKQTCYKVKK